MDHPDPNHRNCAAALLAESVFHWQRSAPARALNTTDGNYSLGSCRIAARVTENHNAALDKDEVWRDGSGMNVLVASMVLFRVVAETRCVSRCSSIVSGRDISWFAGVGSGVGWFSVSMRAAAPWCTAWITREPRKHSRFSQWRVSLRYVAKLVAGILSPPRLPSAAGVALSHT